MPIEGLPSSDQSAAYAGSGGILSTGFNKKVQMDKNLLPVDFEPKAKFKEALIEMISAEGLAEVNPKLESDRDEEQLLYQQELKKLSDRRLNSVVKKKEEGKKKRSAQEELNEEENPSGGAAAGYESSQDRTKKAAQELVKEYISLVSKKIAGRPADTLEGIDVKIGMLKAQLSQEGVLPSDFSYLDQKAIDLLKEGFLTMIRDRFLRSTSIPVNIIDWVLKAKSGRPIIELLNILEKDSISLSEQAELLRSFEISDLTHIADLLGLDIDSFMRGIKSEKINISAAKDNDIFFHAVEPQPVRAISLAVDEYRSSQTEIFLEERLITRLRLGFRSRKLRKNLFDRGMSRSNIESIRTQSRRIAWLKTISRLKENHLRRILTTSSDDFDVISGSIEKLTSKANRLGFDIPKEGIKWIETGLNRLGIETAQYKMELLKSLQKLSYEEKRDADISHLERIINDLNRKLGVNKPA